MNLSDVLDKNIIKVNLNLSNKKDVINYLANILKKNGYVDDVEKYIEDIYHRESMGQTGIGNYIAIPHGVSKSVMKNGIAIGTLNQEISWETLDDKGVKIVFLFAVKDSDNEGDTHLKMLAQVAGKLGNDKIVEKILMTSSVDSLVEILGCKDEGGI